MPDANAQTKVMCTPIFADSSLFARMTQLTEIHPKSQTDTLSCTMSACKLVMRWDVHYNERRA